MESYNKEWQQQKYPETITISKGYFEHLLNCLANQKFGDELPCNGDALSLDAKQYYDIQAQNQKVIDKAWREGMFICTLEAHIDSIYNKMYDKYCENWNQSIPLITQNVIDDEIEYPDDNNIRFKWLQLVPQEIEMWMHLCCFGCNAIINCEKEICQHGRVSLDDFNYICHRRGFTKRMVNFLSNMLSELGMESDEVMIEQPIESEKIDNVAQLGEQPPTQG